MRIKVTLEYEIIPKHYLTTIEGILKHEENRLIERLKNLWSSYREARASVKVESVE